jgi:hypothetical protein
MNIKRGITYLSGVRDGRYNRENCGFEKSWECNGDFIFPFLNCLQKKKYQELMDFLEDTEVGRVVGTEEKEGSSEDE